MLDVLEPEDDAAQESRGCGPQSVSEPLDSSLVEKMP